MPPLAITLTTSTLDALPHCCCDLIPVRDLAAQEMAVPANAG